MKNRKVYKGKAIAGTVRKLDVSSDFNYFPKLGEEARARVIFGLVSKRVTVPENHLNKAIDDYEKAGRFSSAADVAKEAGLTEKVQLYKELEELLK